MSRLIAAVLVLCALAVLGPVPTLAQDATPTAELGEAIDPSECRVEPRSVDELISLVYAEGTDGTPVLGTPEPAPDIFPTSVSIPIGEPADVETVERVNATIREIVACSNAGDFLRLASLLSDDFTSQLSLDPGTSVEEAREELEAPTEPVVEEERWRLIAVTDVSVLEDGRVGALLVSDDPSSPPEGVDTDLVIFIEEGGRWVADGIGEFSTTE